MSQALAGLKVLDLTMNLPGPYMTWLLALLGADVVKVENPIGGDYARALGGGETSPFFAALNRNKKSLALNLKHPEGKRILLDLLDFYDVLIEGFRPGTLDRLGLGYAHLSQDHPRLIYVSISGYGQSGPNRLRAGHDINYLALAGIIGMTGSRRGDRAIPGVQVADIAGGSLMAMTGLLAAIVQRERTGQGQFIDTSMFDGSLSLATMVFAGVSAGFEIPEPGKMLLSGRFPCYGLYETADGLYMSLGALEFKFWENFCSAVGRDDLIGQQYGGPEVVADLEALFASRPQSEWTALFENADACCEPVLSLDEAVNSQLAAARDMVCTRPDGARYLGCPLKMSGSQPPEDEPAPGLGQHTREILGQLGRTQHQIESLSEQGVVGCP